MADYEYLIYRALCSILGVLVRSLTIEFELVF